LKVKVQNRRAVVRTVTITSSGGGDGGGGGGGRTRDMSEPERIGDQYGTVATVEHGNGSCHLDIIFRAKRAE
jgi:hypothetical protein